MRLVLTLVWATLFVGAAQAAPLTFEAALKLADHTAPSLQAKGADITAARSLAIAAGRLPDPRLAVGLGNFPISGPPAGTFGRDSMTMATVGVTQEVPSGAKRRAGRQRAAADIGAAESAQAVEARNVRLNTALAWIDLYYAKKRLAALDEVDKALAPLRTSAPSRIASGSARPSEALEPEQLTAALGDRRADPVPAPAAPTSPLPLGPKGDHHESSSLRHDRRACPGHNPRGLRTKAGGGDGSRRSHAGARSPAIG